MPKVDNNYQYNFRTVAADKLATLLEEQDADVSVEEFFDAQDKAEDGTIKSYKRKPVSVALDLPDFMEELPELAQVVLKQYVADYVKATFIDNFLEVGDHSWETITKEAGEARSGGRISIPDTLLKYMAENFGEFMAQQTGNADMGKRLCAVINGKCTQAAMMKHLTECSEEVINKVQNRLDSWITWIDETGNAEAEDLAEGYKYITQRLTKVKKAITTNVADMVKSLL